MSRPYPCPVLGVRQVGVWFKLGASTWRTPWVRRRWVLQSLDYLEYDPFNVVVNRTCETKSIVNRDCPLFPKQCVSIVVATKHCLPALSSSKKRTSKPVLYSWCLPASIVNQLYNSQKIAKLVHFQLLGHYKIAPLNKEVAPPFLDEV